MIAKNRISLRNKNLLNLCMKMCLGLFDEMTNWYVGRNRSAWRTGIPTFSAVRYPGVYPGTDLLYHGEGGSRSSLICSGAG